MNVWEFDKLFLFVAFVIPGFISIKAFELFHPANTRDGSKQIVDAVTYSCVNYALLLLPIFWIENNKIYECSPYLYVCFYVVVLFVAPLLWAFLWKKLRESQAFQNNAPHPTQKPWDYVFSQRKSYWVIVTLKDNMKVAGKYSSNSFASHAPSPEQIYLEESWELNGDGGFERPHNESAGVIILSSEISYIEFFKLN
ncbi:hypothetical protein EYS14_14790 [Alteromonadaceae bacterium M269]|nr:hypothetical protein EYS14_14790 [Alteromonadaceae bacterium M269]